MRIQLVPSAPSDVWSGLHDRGPVSLGHLVAFFLALGLLACASSAPPPSVKPGPFEPLKSDEGFLVVQIDSDLGIERLDAGTRVVVRDLQPGQHLWMIRMQAGSYHWTGVRLIAQSHGTKVIRPDTVGVLEKKEFEFGVEAGAVNYPGEIVIRMDAPEYGLESGVTFRNRNHSAMAIRKLSKSHAALLAAHPIRYSGSGADGFLQFYTRARDARSRTKPAPVETKADAR